jgi:rubrerythrin
MSDTQFRIKALETALNNELKEKEFYLKHAQKTGNALGKKMFESIAGDEAEHYERISELHKKLRDEGGWPETLPLKVKNTEVKSILNKVVDAVDVSAKADVDDMKAVEIAIEFETKGEEFYKGLFESTSDKQEKEFYRMLMTIEREHRLSLEDTQAFFKDPEAWLQMKEGSRLDGA